ncbi:Melanoma-associated antigen B4 [Apodemus speciosus]|uniref:Melanoma-associated antigen B4 n=1 Tax=Apodemus speciosus TaxID=105296 RepID=A0ABQ0FUN1_APOSI
MLKPRQQRKESHPPALIKLQEMLSQAPSAAGFPQQSQSSAPSNTGGKVTARRRSGKGDQSQGDENKSSSHRAPLATGSPQMDVLTRKTGMLMEYMLCKYKVKQPMRKGEMLKVINRRFKEHFPEILKKASYRLDMVFGLELKESSPTANPMSLSVS